MKRALLIFALGVSAVGAPIDGAYAERLATSIWHAEGGHKTRFPYGVLSVRVKNASHARQVCLATIQRNHARWQAAGAQGDYLEFLASRYCPGADSAIWLKNVKYFMKRSA